MAVDVGEALDQRDQINYYICRLKDAPNPRNGAKFIEFILSERAKSIYGAHGFVPHRDDEISAD